MLEQDGHLWKTGHGEEECLNCGKSLRKYLQTKERIQKYPSLVATIDQSCKKGE